MSEEVRYRVVRTFQGAMQFRVDWRDAKGVLHRIGPCADAYKQANLIIEQHKLSRSRLPDDEEVVRYIE